MKQISQKPKFTSWTKINHMFVLILVSVDYYEAAAFKMCEE